MKIGFDAKRAVYNNTGLGNYSRLIIDVLAQFFPRNEYLLYTPKIKANNRLSPILSKSQVSIHTPVSAIGRAFSSLWRIGSITQDVKADKVDIFHGLSNELPLNIATSGIASVVTIHDLIFLRYPEYYKLIDRKIYNYKFRKACENANRIIAISECTKRDIIHYYGINESKIDVVYQGCDESFKHKCTEQELIEVKKEYNLPDKFVLNIGTIESRKNLLLLIKALPHLDNDINVVAIGRRTPYIDEIVQYITTHSLQDRVHFYHNIPFSALPAMYQLAQVFVYPSRFEGFGIPILEALSCGTPAIGATGSCLEEAGGTGSIYINPDDEISLATEIKNILFNATLRSEMIAKGLEYSNNFNKEAIAINTMNVYKKILKTND